MHQPRQASISWLVARKERPGDHNNNADNLNKGGREPDLDNPLGWTPVISDIGVNHEDGIDNDELKTHQQQDAKPVKPLELDRLLQIVALEFSFREGGRVFTGVGSVSPISEIQNALSPSSEAETCGATSSDMRTPSLPVYR